MRLYPPDELMMQVFLPSVRQLVAMRLRSQGLSQGRIASLLGTTQASVSLYLSSEPGKPYKALASLNVSKTDADAYAERVTAAASKGPVDGVRTLATIWSGMLGRGWVCDAHRSLHPSLATCDYCVQEYGSRRGELSDAVAEVEEAVRALEGSEEFVSAMPEVSVNIACATGGASTPADVVAVPGRIVKVRGRAKALLPPEAGASAHMARVLLLARTQLSSARACVNLRYDPRMARAMKRMGIRPLFVSGASASAEEDPTVAALEGALRGTRVRFDAVVEEGGGGIEPNVYLFGAGAREAAALAIRLAKAYSAR